MKLMTWTELSDRKTREEFCRRTGFVDVLSHPHESKVQGDKAQPNDTADTHKSERDRLVDC